MKNEMMKRLFALLLALLLALPLLSACTAGGGLNPDAQAALEQAGDALSALLGDQPGGEAATATPGTQEAAEGAGSGTDGGAPVLGQAYSDPEGVAAYLNAFGELPPNFITKNDAQSLGWDSGAGNLWDVAPGKSIGGDRFGNREGLLPAASGRTWYECDVNYEGGYRGAERIVYSSDGLIYYTNDHYASFTLLYGEE